MTPRTWVVLALGLGVLGAAGCATVGLQPATLEATVTPATVHPGDVAVLKVLAPAGTRSVRGRLGIPNSPTVALRTTDQGRTWIFRTQIPLEAAWQTGRYKVVLLGEGPDGAALNGETWIIAQ